MSLGVYDTVSTYFDGATPRNDRDED